jgi:hypothetical protein
MRRKLRMKNFVSQNNFTWFIGVVEDQYFFVERDEGLKLHPNVG